jgi:peptidoglycan hydrolase-like protein with peptidoglycan-binding domain
MLRVVTLSALPLGFPLQDGHCYGPAPDDPQEHEGGDPADEATIRWLQAALAIPATGSYDVRTVAVVCNFQGRHGLPMTGTVDSTTWAAVRRRFTPRRA